MGNREGAISWQTCRSAPPLSTPDPAIRAGRAVEAFGLTNFGHEASGGIRPPERLAHDSQGRAGETCVCENRCRPNGLEVNPRGQGPRAEAAAARRLPAFEARDAGGVTPRKLRFPSRLGRRAEAGPRRVLPRVRPCSLRRVLNSLRPLKYCACAVFSFETDKIGEIAKWPGADEVEKLNRRVECVRRQHNLSNGRRALRFERVERVSTECECGALRYHAPVSQDGGYGDRRQISVGPHVPRMPFVRIHARISRHIIIQNDLMAELD